MQTFVIGWGGGAGGRGVQVYSAPMLHWAAAGEAHLRTEGRRRRWKGRGKDGGAGGEKDVVSNLRLQTRRQKKMGGKSAPVLFSILHSSTISIQLF